MTALLTEAPRYARKSAAEDLADKLTTPFSVPPIPVLEIAETHGVDVVFTDFGAHSENVAGFCDFRAEKLYVNADDGLARQGFTIAHELGHWLLHRSIFEKDPERYPVLPRFQNPNRFDPLEQEANHFAACLLVPSRLVRPLRGAGVSVLADIFGVSRTMMEFRLKNVG